MPNNVYLVCTGKATSLLSSPPTCTPAMVGTTNEALKKKLHGSYVNICTEISSIILSLDTLPLPLCTLDNNNNNNSNL